MDRCLSDLHRQITKGIEKRKCRMCTEQVLNDYASQKKHVIDKHILAISSNQRQSRFVSILERCFKQDGQIFITNDLQCNVCGQELKDKSKFSIKYIYIFFYLESRMNHVAQYHTDYQWTCSYKDCNHPFKSFRMYQIHLNVRFYQNLLNYK